MSLGPQYTSCVEAKDFEPINQFYVGVLAAAVVVGSIAALFTGGLGLLIAIPAFVEALHYVSDWMLNHKLICLHRDPSKMCGDHEMVWVLGEVADTEDVGEDKNPIEDIDNDYAMNVIPAPFDMMAFGDSAQNNLKLSTTGTPQGDLLAEQPGMPKFEGYFRTMIVTMSDKKYRAWTDVVGRDYGWTGIIGPDQQKAWSDYVADNAWLLPEKRSVPVLHCEFEGSRIKDVLDATNTFDLGSSWCKKNWFTKFVCKVVQIITSPVILVVLAKAWAGAKDGDPADALEGGGTISSKDQVIAGGRWTFDGAHDGYNEFHATRIVQKVAYVPKDPAAFADYYKRWCELQSQVPHTDPSGNSPPGSTPQGSAPGPPLSPKQQETYDNQQRPENQWVLHPAVDGCQPLG
ncbi:MAG TPA: hypothetical protein VFD75_09265 [Pyrinomonadaceae bacterium]|nr:hypothetical protein [Pyrinomonadaceae bacterium]